MTPEYLAVLERKRGRLFSDWSPLGKRGAEIGPLNRPIVRRSDSDVIYVDHCSTDELRKKYHKEEDTKDLEHIDLVWSDQPLSRMLGDRQPLDFVVASHVIEHVPDLCGWLHEMHDCLSVGGVLLLIVPDKRFTFDVHRAVSNPQEVREAYKERRRRPSKRLIADHFANVVSADTWRLWDDYTSIDNLEYCHPPEFIDEGLRAFERGQYVDVHCWVFTPWHFMRLMGLIVSETGLCFDLRYFLTTQDHDLEFYVQLERTNSPTTNWSIEATRARLDALWPSQLNA
ncbi:methyltransferase domain-containing protein [Ruegeria sp. Alg231-54]|uniref:methyltransferase domain-containing protein n=1 Tax=Ruegeria sp. Alg231-54 TaxID=1922221 RepID=UPI000D558C1F|nr:methyltransferase domain-containing protein [Ruegeria sp. Alg231-54]